MAPWSRSASSWGRGRFAGGGSLIGPGSHARRVRRSPCASAVKPEPRCPGGRAGSTGAAIFGFVSAPSSVEDAWRRSGRDREAPASLEGVRPRRRGHWGTSLAGAWTSPVTPGGTIVSRARGFEVHVEPARVRGVLGWSRFEPDARLHGHGDRHLHAEPPPPPRGGEQPHPPGGGRRVRTTGSPLLGGQGFLWSSPAWARRPFIPGSRPFRCCTSTRGSSSVRCASFAAARRAGWAAS